MSSSIVNAWKLSRYDTFVSDYERQISEFGKKSGNQNIDYQLCLSKTLPLSASNGSDLQTVLKREILDLAAFLRVIDSAKKLPLLLGFYSDHLSTIMSNAVNPFQKGLKEFMARKEESSRGTKKNVDGGWESALEAQNHEERNSLIKKMTDTVDRVFLRVQRAYVIFVSVLDNDDLLEKNVLDLLEILEAFLLPPSLVNNCISNCPTPESMTLISVLTTILQEIASIHQKSTTTVASVPEKKIPTSNNNASLSNNTSTNIFTKFIQNINKGSSGSANESHNHSNNSNNSNNSVLSDSMSVSASGQKVIEQESFTFFLGLQVKMMQNLILCCCDFMSDLVLSPSDYFQNWGLRLQTITTLYSSDLRGLVVTVSLSQIQNRNYLTGLFENTEIFWECQKSPECHFPCIKEQLENALTLMPEEIREGDVLLTRHSNLSQAHVIFHVIVKNLLPSNETITNLELGSQSRLVAGLKAVAKLSYQYDVRHLTIPLLMLGEDQFPGKPVSAIPSLVAEHQNILLKRCEIILKSMRGYLLENMYILKDPAISEAPTARTITYCLPRSHRSLFASVRNSVAAIYKAN